MGWRTALGRLLDVEKVPIVSSSFLSLSAYLSHHVLRFTAAPTNNISLIRQ